MALLAAGEAGAEASGDVSSAYPAEKGRATNGSEEGQAARTTEENLQKNL